jgi:alpha-acetolactate decarboxylase
MIKPSFLPEASIVGVVMSNCNSMGLVVGFKCPLGFQGLRSLGVLLHVNAGKLTVLVYHCLVSHLLIWAIKPGVKEIN